MGSLGNVHAVKMNVHVVDDGLIGRRVWVVKGLTMQHCRDANGARKDGAWRWKAQRGRKMNWMDDDVWMMKQERGLIGRKYGGGESRVVESSLSWRRGVASSVALPPGRVAVAAAAGNNGGGRQPVVTVSDVRHRFFCCF